MSVTDRPDTFEAFLTSLLNKPENHRYAAAIKEMASAAQYDWNAQARPEQKAPDGEWNVWMILAGRGWGKTRTGAEYTKEQIRKGALQWAVVAPTFSDARDTCIEGPSGLLSVLPPSEVRTWNRSLGELILHNGSRVKLFSADEPDRIRGFNGHGSWCDELAAWRYADAWDQLQFALRIGPRPRTVVTTTPRPNKLVRSILKREDVVTTRGSTFDNASNLAPSALAQLRAQYEGTRIGRQELYGELLLDTPGAKWTLALIDDTRVSAYPDLVEVAVAVDPSGGAGEGHDEQGIAVVGRGVDGHGYLVDDRSCSLSPDGWGRRAVQAYLDHAADLIVVEKNYGGDMAESTIRTAAQAMGVPNVKIEMVRSSRGKALRAEPVAALYEQGRFHHVGSFPELEDQQTSWTPDSGMSPDRLDALVFAATRVMLDQPKRGFVV